MKTKFRSLIAGTLLLALVNLTVANGRAAQSPAPAPVPAKAASVAPRVVTQKAPLSASDVAKYQQLASDSRQAANGQAAGASGGKTALVVVGVVAAVGLIALAAGGGGGGGGGY